MQCLLRRTYAPAALLAAHPPDFQHANKRLVFELACPPEAAHAGSIEVTRWRGAALPDGGAATELEVVRGFYDYAPCDVTAWHVNFADPDLFFGYGIGLLAQDELQCAEHPLLGSIREALIAEGEPALTDDGEPTPVLVAGVERRCAIDDALYGNRFAASSPDTVRASVRVFDPPRPSNLIAIAAPANGRGAYTRDQIERIVLTAATAFAAAKRESRGPIEIRTGYWGCGAFGGNRELMVMLQILAARRAGVERLRFYASTDADTVHRGAAALDRLGSIERIAAAGYAWGAGNGT